MKECYDEFIVFVESELSDIEKELKEYERIRNLKDIEEKARNLANALKKVGYEFPTEEQYEETYIHMENLRMKRSALLQIKDMTIEQMQK
ncbi:MAG: hypothetical protein ACK5MV_00085 [Aminipila sp.]